MIQPIENEETVLQAAPVAAWAAPASIVGFRETEDNRYLITLHGLCRFRLTGEMDARTACRGRASATSRPSPAIWPSAPDEDLPRERLLAALKSYLNSRDMKADWKSVMTAPAEALVNALAMMCPFDPAEKQALLEAPELPGPRHHPAGAAGNGRRFRVHLGQLVLMLRQAQHEDLHSPPPVHTLPLRTVEG